MRRQVCAALALVTAGFLGVGALPALADDAPTYTLPAGTPAYIRAAIEDPARSAEQKARDANRKPAELLEMSGIRPGHTVVEFASFGASTSRPSCRISWGPKGTVYMYDLPYTEQRSGDASRAFVAAHANSHYQLVDYNTLELPKQVDEVFIVLYYHDLFINKIDTANLDTRIFNALKPGGTLLIVDHNAVPGSGTTDTQNCIASIRP